MFCQKCGNEIDQGAAFCGKCGARATVVANNYNQTSNSPPPINQRITTPAKSKTTAGLLGIFLGGLGIHRFYLGYTMIGVIQIVVSFLTGGIGALWGFVEGILILTGSMNTDAEGRLLEN
ncbi:MAG: TM2 domain-containing protein [Bacillota bacterium]